jgi:predicted RNA binding protein YcfA (HicA-like mRNA interferase family)
VKIPRDLAGADLVKALCRDWRYRVIHQQGSHIILETDDPGHQRISVPAHARLRVGTLSTILRSVAQHKGVRREDLLRTLR